MSEYIVMGSHYLTNEGLTKLKKELEFLKNEKMPEIVERIARAKELGDLSENAEYQDAKDEQGFSAGRIVELESLIRNAVIIEESGNKDFVTIGSTIEVRCGSDEFTYTITGSNEANPAAGLISNESPLGRAFLGRKVGEKVKVMIPRGDMDCEILNIQ
ncbi:MAG: transcription elongation factor GreA [Candidatus Buchananbacteria bacterium RIFCSPHIGHO2_01_FULL_47_11b]|uniref:Transcription elongation factor GreA n=1 Tax=Candidatus Buchananbacteria bacterium RIFCSPHIGHO2_01_FULL_47_11b TaxID=1797537 RepID=A0A1G1Y751_9BACT|nr:MAG: transcription elongation factor GreA [Candidatus Buchananbacteria bacterium RIFCSPHIGHO2_01_FULL_47_11b]